MSAEATGWVFKHSPMQHADFLVHLAIADSVNDQYDNEFWASLQTLADKTRLNRDTVRTAMRKLQDVGLLVALEQVPGRTTRYRLLMPDPAAPSANLADIKGTEVPRGGSDPAEMAANPAADSANPAAPSALPRGSSAPIPIEPKQPNRTQALTLASVDFEAFWSQYPRRNGQRMGKAAASKQWDKLKPADRVEATRMLPAYSSAVGDFPKDAERYLRSHLWRDIDEHAKPTARTQNERNDEAARRVAQMVAGRNG